MADVEMNNTTEVYSNGEAKVEPMDSSEGVKQESQTQPNEQNTEEKYAGNETYQMYLSKKLHKKAAEKLMELCEKLNLTTEDFDERAVELLASFSFDQAIYILSQLEESKMYGVQNKPQYLMAVMKNFRDRVRSIGAQSATSLPLIAGPNPDKLKEIVDCTGYQLEITVGQRKYYLPEQANGEKTPSAADLNAGCIYVGQIPSNIYEDELIPLFEEIGKIHNLRLMMDPVNGKSRGYAFLIYCDKDKAPEAAKKFDGYEIQPGKTLKVNVSVANTRLFLGNIPKSKSKDDILEELKKHAEGVTDVLVYANTEGGGENRKNRGFCFVDFVDHKAASDAKRRISQGKVRPWNNDLVVDWAEQQDEPDEETMATVKVLYLKNVKESLTEERLKEVFEEYGEVERAKKIRDYAFIHFKERDHAVLAMEKLNGTVIDECELDISLAKPQGDQKQKKKIAQKRVSGSGRNKGPGNYGGYGDWGATSGSRGRNSNGSYKGAYPPVPPYGGYPPPGPYDPYGGYGAPYYGGPYDPYSGYGADPYYGSAGYGPGPAMSGPRSDGRNQSSGRSGGRGRTGGGRGNNRGRGSGGRGSKRPGGDAGGPASKRAGGNQNDFASDVQMNMF